MSHLHIPDGLMGPEWWITGYILTAILVAWSVRMAGREEGEKKIPLLGVMGALMLLTMSVPLGPIPYHLNLTVLGAILLGPWLGFLAIFIVNLFLAMVGHGGITVVGINTLVIGSEVFLGYYLFRVLSHKLATVPAAGAATLGTLLLSSGLMVTMVGFSQVGGEEVLHHLAGDDHVHEQIALHEPEPDHEEHEGEAAEAALTAPAPAEGQGWASWGRLATLVFPVTIVGAGLEAIATALVVRFFLRVRPGLIPASGKGDRIVNG